MNRRPFAPDSARADTKSPNLCLLHEMLKDGLALLWRGFEYARQLEADIWEFALNGETLRRAGLSDIDLHWLINSGYLDCSSNPIPDGGQQRSSPKDHPWNESNAQFVLTKTGALLALQVLSRPLHDLPSTPTENEKSAGLLELSENGKQEPDLGASKPTWDRDRKELRFQERVIKQFRWAAVNQETILMAFEEESWPTRIDDPLPQKHNQDPKSRLHDTIKCLNRNHKVRLIRFIGDGTGEGIRWMFLHRDLGDA